MQRAVNSFFSFWLPQCAVKFVKPRTDACARPQVYANETKSTQGREPKKMKKSVKKTALIPYLDTIEIISIVKMRVCFDFMGVLCVLKVERLIECCWLNLKYVRILSGVKQQERNGGFFLDKLRKVLNVFV